MPSDCDLFTVNTVGADTLIEPTGTCHGPGTLSVSFGAETDVTASVALTVVKYRGVG